MRCSSHLSPALPASVLNALVDQLSGRDTAFERNTSQKFLKVAAQCVTCQVTSAVSRNISVLRKTVMKGDKTCCKQFRSMFLFIPEQISCNITIAGRIQLLFHHSAKVLPVVLCRLTLNISGVEVGQPSSRVLSGSLPLPQRTWRWVCARQTPGTPEGSGVLGWHFPQPQLCPTTHAGAAWGIPPLFPSKRVAGQGAPQKELCGITQGSHDVPGPFMGLSLPLRESS